MNKAELLQSVALRLNCTQREANQTLEAILATIVEALDRNEKVLLVGFGTFEVRERATRKGRNPKTGEEITIPARRVVVFRPGGRLTTKSVS